MDNEFDDVWDEFHKQELNTSTSTSHNDGVGYNYITIIEVFGCVILFIVICFFIKELISKTITYRKNNKKSK